MDVDRAYKLELEGKAREIDERIESGEIPKIVYKFRSWNDSPNDYIIKRKTIRLSSPLELQADYPELRLPINESLITEAYMQRVALNEAKKYYPQVGSYMLEKIANEEIRPKLTLDIKEEREWAYQKIREANDKLKGVFCASYTFEHLDQWIYLADNATGFAVGFSLKEIYLKKEIFGVAGYVEYYPSNQIPTLEPYSFSEQERREKSMKEIFAVPDRYKHEREYRIVRSSHKYDSNGNIAEYTEKERIVNLKNEDYIEILLGPEMEINELNELVTHCKENIPNVDIYETIIVGQTVKKGSKIN